MGHGGIAAQRRLELGQLQRAQGQVVLTVLAGEPQRGAAQWRAWAAQHRMLTLETEADDEAAAVAELVAAVPWLRALPGARARLAALAGVEPAELTAAVQARGDHELARWLDELSGDEPVARTAAWLLLATRDGPSPWTRAPLPPAQLLVALAKLAAPISLLWRAPQPTPAHWLARALRAAGGLAMHAPGLAIAVAAPPPAVAEAARALAGSALGSLLHGGLVPIDDEPQDRAASAVGEPRRQEPSEERPLPRGEPRSRAEATLYQALERDPRTRGRFALNQRLELAGATAEIDLLAPAARLAIEVDGWYHFREPERYRRDRTKDVRLQRGAYFVMRFLAEDVDGDRLAYTVDEIACILLELSSETRTPPATRRP